MKPVRRQRISSFLRVELAKILQHEIKDPRIGFHSVLSVDPTDDLKEAVVRLSLMGTEAEQRTTMRGIEAARGYIQTLLGERCSFRQTPILRFEQDQSIEKSMNIEALINQARSEDDEAARQRESSRDRPEETPEE